MHKLLSYNNLQRLKKDEVTGRGSSISADEIISMQNSLSENALYAGNCLDLLGRLESQSVDLTVFSPPYDGVRDYNGFSFDHNKLGAELFRVSREGSVAACIIGDGTREFAKSLTSFRLTIDFVDRHGWKLFECCLYARLGRPGKWWNQRFRVDHEFILIFFKGDRPKYFDKTNLKIPTKYAGVEWHGTTRQTSGEMVVNKPHILGDEKCRGTIWKFSTSNTEGNRVKLEHPATMPDMLAADLIQCFSAPNDLILDPFVGSGTTAVMARKLGRRFIGMDISAEYIEIAKRRLENEITDSIL
jgi:DNA modification methylase